MKSPTVADLSQRLRELHKRTVDTPQFNPVFQLAHDLSRQLEAGELSLDDCEALIAELEVKSLHERAARLECMVAPIPADANEKALAATLRSDDFDAFRASWERPQLHAVFTAHPTFLLTPDQSEAVAREASGGDAVSADCVGGDRPQVTLAYEHGRAMQAIGHAQDARSAIVAQLLRHAKAVWPDKWTDLAPLPFRFASWVGYDMDGRTDITWSNSIGFRLSEKAKRLARYVADLEAIDAGHKLLSELRPASLYALERAQDFTADLSDPAALSVAANRLTAPDPRKLLSLAPYIDRLEAEAASPDDGERAIQLKTLAAAMRADGLGMGWIHFRVNAKQLHNAIRRRVDPDGNLDLASKGAVVHLRRAIEGLTPRRSNFGALAIEASTAIRQFLAMAQILAHVDADAPIRMLIAECEEPATVLAALYFAKLFGIEDKVDISPLFETETALEHGGRFLDELLAEKVYQDYAKVRGRVAIQTGFSDAGRFVGQIPASLAIERLQGRLAQAIHANGLSGDVAALIFNTHGESMGRGAHPAKMADRLDWALSPWAKRRFARAGIPLEPEVSFQGGDGYLWFATPELARALLTRIAVLRPSETDADAPKDSFYQRTDLSLDFYRAVKEHQREHLESATYSRAITAFGLGLLNSTGSRVSRRQSDINADREMSLRQIRAIPHNAILQQLSYPVNVIAGVGTAADGNFEEIGALLSESARGRELMRLVRASNALASVKTVAAYGELFNSAYWSSRPYRGTETHLAEACEALGAYLVKDDRIGVFRRLASRLRVDAMKLHRLFAHVPDEDPVENREEKRRMIGVLQALRIALLQAMFIRAVSVPAFSRANDVSRDDVLEMVFTLRVDEALAQLRRAYPRHFPRIDRFDLTEPTDWPDGGDEGYEAIHRDYIDPIERAHALNLRITTAIANIFGAHG
ncbi:phosphoenolpyruvate carboxylase [Aurantiacibacter gangjinensis]|uniref:Phosphoenolpyruvate carboxylase n=1 Tax=Aurantiacibacter gangjinensis TaxID=502682 RepID=A0A0G9MP03_9SPHN|nr:phosphoenolpyruvate carboxylase [Aurantiacibacter gangjinensis]APE29389.1 Phosphoenolpyruvate carboxylase [Aurantiacibacter gangjinensis]KLE31043.1 phosphoenolpyruvate carboxylase [Aurantiacibacter gangjinensis]